MGRGQPITRDRWPERGPHRRLLEFYDRIHRVNLLRSLSEIIEHGNRPELALGLSGTTSVNDILTGNRLPADQKQAAALARALGGSTEEAERAGKLFGAALADRRKLSAAVGTRSDKRRPDGRRDAELEEIADLLADAMRKQWLSAANDRGLLEPAPLPMRWRRSSVPVAGAVSEATRVRDDGLSFPPLPGMNRPAAGGLREGGREGLLKVYAGLPSGRLVIIGDPGSGKSSAAVHLLLDALNHRDQVAQDDRPHVPVPVMFPLTGWDPMATSVADWLTGKLSEIPLLRGRRGRQLGRRLLDEGRISVFLDGLDEMPEPARFRALQALSKQATFRLVVTLRTDDLVVAAKRYALTSAAAVELQPLSPKATAKYLLRPVTDPVPRPWQAVADALTDQPDSPIAGALTSPLDVTLLRDIYAPGLAVSGLGAVDELLDTDRFPDASSITRHLLGHAVPAAYAPHPGTRLAPYAQDTPRRTLALIAGYLNERGAGDLAWWTVAAWLPGPLRVLISCVAAMLLSGLCLGLASLVLNGFRTWPVAWLETAGWHAVTNGLPVSLAVVLAFNLTTGRTDRARPTERPADRWARSRAVGRVCATVSFGVAMTLVTGIIVGGWARSVSAFLFILAIAYGSFARTRGTAVLMSLSVGRQLWSARRFGFAILVGLAFAAADGVLGLFVLFTLLSQGSDPVEASTYVIASVVACFLAITLLAWLTGLFTRGGSLGRTDVTDPVGTWRGDFWFWLVVAVGIGLASGINGWLVSDTPVYGLTDSHASLLTDAVVGGLATGVADGMIVGRAWLTTVTQIWFTVRYRTPLRLGRFLDDSRRRHLLRTVGPTYQFRHATLQDHLARRR